MKRRMLVIPALMGAALIGATILQARGVGLVASAEKAAGSLRRPGDAAPAAPVDTTRWVAAEGRVVTYPGGEIRVSTERGGRLVRLLVAESRKVERGALLAEFDTAELRAALEAVRARIAEADADVRLAARTLGRRQELVTRQVAAVQEVDAAERDRDASSARLAALRAEADRLRVQIDKCRISAPIAGTVTASHADPGEVLEAGDPLFDLVDLDHLRLQGEADESDAGRVVPGAPVRITADAYPGQVWAGTVEEVPGWVGPRSLKPVDPARPSDTRVLGLKVRFDGPTPLKLGTTVELRVAAR